MAMGPLATNDLAGLDVGWRIRKEYRHLEKPGIRQAFAADNLCEMGRFGQKTGAGWYKYDQNRRPSPDPKVAALRKKWSAEAGIQQRQVPAEEIVDRCIYALVNEGARILEEACRAPSILTSSTSTAMASQPIAAVPCGTPRRIEKVHDRVTVSAHPWRALGAAPL
jgi:3-hydroxyacyl-CoA dehydrogenase